MHLSSVLITLCPHCRKKTEYAPNPYYMHICEHCGHKCGQSDLINALDKEKIEHLEKQIAILKSSYPVA